MARLRERSPVTWLSLRIDARTADNQEQFLEQLMIAVAERFPNAGFILDGFSYPADFDSALYRQPGSGDAGHRPMLRRLLPRGSGYLARTMKSREQAVTARVSGFMRRLQKRIPSPIVSVSGLGLVDSIYLGHLADYYVCHAGTLQHKIAWIYNIPGAVHSNTTGVGKGTGRWLANQLEEGLQPFMVPPEHIDDLDTIRTANQVRRNRDYHIRDIDAAVAGIIGDMEARTGAEGTAKSGEPGSAAGAQLW